MNTYILLDLFPKGFICQSKLKAKTQSDKTSRLKTKSNSINKNLYSVIVLTMIGVSNSNKTSYRNGCQSRTNAYI